MKKCAKCLVIKNSLEFNKNKSKKDGLQTYCKICQRKKDKLHYKDNESRRISIKEKRYNAKKKAQDYIFEYLLNHPCVDCNENNPVLLEFDHIDASSKINNVSGLLRYSFDKVVKEIEKCEIRCANCHRMKSAKQFQYYIYKKSLEMGIIKQ